RGAAVFEGFLALGHRFEARDAGVEGDGLREARRETALTLRDARVQLVGAGRRCARSRRRGSGGVRGRRRRGRGRRGFRRRGRIGGLAGSRLLRALLARGVLSLDGAARWRARRGLGGRQSAGGLLVVLAELAGEEGDEGK